MQMRSHFLALNVVIGIPEPSLVFDTTDKELTQTNHSAERAAMPYSAASDADSVGLRRYDRETSTSKLDL